MPKKNEDYQFVLDVSQVDKKKDFNVGGAQQ